MTTPIRRPNTAATFPHFLGAVRRAGETRIVEPVLAAATAHADEASGAEGGYAVPPDFEATVMEALLAQWSLPSRCTMIPSRSNSVTLPIDVESAYSTSGVQLKPVPEGGTIAQSKLKVQSRSFRLSKLSAFVPLTSELVEDAPGAALETYFASVVAKRLDYLLTEHILRGDGVNKSLGILNSDALITVSKESGQSAGTLVVANVEKMLARLAVGSRGRHLARAHLRGAGCVSAHRSRLDGRTDDARQALAASVERIAVRPGTTSHSVEVTLRLADQSLLDHVCGGRI